MEYMTEAELESTIREVIKRSVIDAEFRALAVENGNAAIAKVSGSPLPSGSLISFINNYGTSGKCFVLPKPTFDPELLSEESLDQIAGGGCENGVTTISGT